MFKSRSRLFTVQPNFPGEEEEKTQKIFYWVLRNVHRELREKARGVRQLSSSIFCFTYAPFIYSSSLIQLLL